MLVEYCEVVPHWFDQFAQTHKESSTGLREELRAAEDSFEPRLPCPCSEDTCDRVIFVTHCRTVLYRCEPWRTTTYHCVLSGPTALETSALSIE